MVAAASDSQTSIIRHPLSLGPARCSRTPADGWPALASRTTAPAGATVLGGLALDDDYDKWRDLFGNTFASRVQDAAVTA